MANAARSRMRRFPGWLASLCAAALLFPGPVLADEAAASLRIASAPSVAWEALTDFPAWPSIFPDVIELSLDRGSEGPARLHQVIRVFGMRIEHTSAVRFDEAQRRLDLTLDPSAPHDVADLDATWTITPDGMGGCVVELRSRFTASQAIPGFIRHRVLARSVQASVEALVAEVARRSEATRIAGVP